MVEVHMLHGCVPSWRPQAQLVRNYVAEDALRKHLSGRDRAYGPLSDLADRDALTVDDSTRGAARACVLARAAGHDVTLFVNPAQIADRRTYWFSRFDAVLDARRVDTVTLDGREFPLDPGPPLRAFRLAAKARLMALPAVEAEAAVDDLAARLRAGAVVVPEHALTLSLDSLLELVERGVGIGSHGWDHRDIAGMTLAEVVADLRRAREWFQAHLGLSPAHYAVPYGLVPLPEPATAEVGGMVLLASPALGFGPVGERHWNRRAITGDLQGRAQ